MDNLGTNKMQSKGHFYFVFKQEMSGGNAFYCFMGFLLNMPGRFSTFFLQINPLHINNLVTNKNKLSDYFNIVQRPKLSCGISIFCISQKFMNRWSPNIQKMH